MFSEIVTWVDSSVSYGCSENVFYEWFQKEKPKTKRTYLPILWSQLDWEETAKGKDHTPQLTAFIESLPKDREYFTIVNEGPAAKQIQPFRNIPNCLTFNGCLAFLDNLRDMGGWTYRLITKKQEPMIPFPETNPKLVPMPLLNGYEKWQDTGIYPAGQKERFASFHGALGNHWCRKRMAEICYKNPDRYYIEQIPGHNRYEWREYLSQMSRSIFSLAPRGTGNTSYRLWEALLVGSVPVYISDEFWLPRYVNQDFIWDDIMIRVHVSELDWLDEILSSYPTDRIKRMVENGQAFAKKYLQWDRFCLHIVDMENAI